MARALDSRSTLVKRSWWDLCADHPKFGDDTLRHDAWRQYTDHIYALAAARSFGSAARLFGPVAEAFSSRSEEKATCHTCAREILSFSRSR